MGKLAVISDLHVDINKIGDWELGQLTEVLREQQVTRVHLAGDTANTVERLLEVVTYLETEKFIVTYNFGNHEMPDVLAEEIEAYPEPHFLNQAYVSLNDELVLLAYNGWYDYSFSLDNDDSKSLAAKNLYWYDRLIERDGSDPDILQDILVRLEKVLDELQAKNKSVIVATHFVPRREFIVNQKGRYARWNQLNAFLGSAKMGELFDQYDNITQVVFGHTHRHFELETINGAEYIARPFGYFYEWFLTRDFVLENNLMKEFNPMGVRRVLKEHQAAFQAYRQSHIKKELKGSMTIVDF